MIQNYKNEPIKCDEMLYDKAIEQYTSIVSKYKEVKSIIQIGNVGVAGISDIDLIVYLDENMVCDNNYSLYQIDKKFHHILMHDVFIIPSKYINESYLVTSIFDTKRIYGKDIEISKNENDKENVIEKLILLNDQAVVSLLHEYQLWDEIKTKDLKLIIARLNSIKYPILLLSNVAKYFQIQLNNQIHYEKFVNEFTSWRKNWFSNTLENNLVKLDYFIKKAKNLIAPQILSDILIINKNINYYKMKVVNSIYSLAKNNHLKGNSEYFINLYIYAKEDGEISRYISNKLELQNNIEYCNSTYLNIAQKRINIVNDIYSFREKNKIYYGELWTFGKTNMPLSIKIINKLKRIFKKLISFPGIKK